MNSETVETIASPISVSLTSTSPVFAPPLEVWAGIECTVNRVGNIYFDQLEQSGHAERLTDLDLFAELGISALRYPILWERVAPEGLESADWRWTDERLHRLRDLGIQPIVGLVHHGSGPHYTSLIDPAFPSKLAEFAQAVAERYPWITYYTPVNEPLTTARFSGLYGHWYPHGRDSLTFIRALLGQCRAVVMAMQAIRAVNPKAQLVQTEDLGKVFSTPLLSYQAEFENERRWLSFDLLCGRLTLEQPMGQYLCQLLGIEELELEWFLAHPCPPDIFGINHYLTSDRFLDERLDRYPASSYGSNGKHTYADIAAVRVCAEAIGGVKERISEIWERYRVPGTFTPTIAITEVHLGCTREEQLRWFKEAWDAAQALQAEGQQIRAVTAWSLLGAYDWDSLVTRVAGHYESGVFDVRPTSNSQNAALYCPRPTALAHMIRTLAQGQTYTHPILDVPGWWRRSGRLLYPPVSCAKNLGNQGEREDLNPQISTKSIQPLLIIGATGTLGQAFARICEDRGIPYRLLTRYEMDITHQGSVDLALLELQPWAVINTAGYVRVDEAERESDLCHQINAEGATILAHACAERSIALITFSTDLVFNGINTNPYIESDPVAPLNVYGYSKAKAEQQVLAAHPRSLVIRTSAFFGPWDESNFLTLALNTLASGHSFIAAKDAIVSPTYVPDLVHTGLDLLLDGEWGLWHVANTGAVAWAELAQWTAKLAGYNPDRIDARPIQELGLTALRPTYSVLGSERGTLLPDLEGAIVRYLRDRKV